MKVYKLSEETNTKITVFLLKNVKNIIALKEKIVSGELDCCALKPALILNHFHIIIAANKAACSKKQVSKNISQALTKFGINDEDESLIIVIFDENGGGKYERIKDRLDGEISEDEEFGTFSDVSLIKKTYKISDKELEVSQLIDSVLSRISTKDFGSF